MLQLQQGMGEKQSWFAVLVDYEWIEQRGFQVWEASTPVDIDGTVGAAALSAPTFINTCNRFTMNVSGEGA
jgi:hypothetical protein